jgi:hypothetical protein
MEAAKEQPSSPPGMEPATFKANAAHAYHFDTKNRFGSEI